MPTTTRVLPLVKVPHRPKKFLPVLNIPPAKQFNWLITRGWQAKESGFLQTAIELGRKHHFPIKPVQWLKAEVDREHFDDCLKKIRDPNFDQGELPWVIVLADALVEKAGMPKEELNETLKTLQQSVREQLGI